MSYRWRVCRPSLEWANAKWNNNDLETFWIPISMPFQDANLLFFLRRIFGQAPFLISSSTYINLQIPTPTTPLHQHVVNKFDGTGFTSEAKCVVDAIAQFPMMSILIRGLVPNTGRNDSYWVYVDDDTQKRRTTGKESRIFQYFKAHPLAERELLFVILSFL